jgi:hypothetical protein
LENEPTVFAKYFSRQFFFCILEKENLSVQKRFGAKKNYLAKKVIRWKISWQKSFKKLP